MGVNNLVESPTISCFKYVGTQDISAVEGDVGDVCRTLDGTMYCYLDEIGW